MRKARLLSLALALLLLCMALLAVSCGNTQPPEHTHTYETGWQKDANEHWHAASCEHTSETSGRASHTYDKGTVTTEPTESADGVKTFACTVCGHTKTETIPKLAHTHAYSSTVVDPTCTEEGYTLHSCACGHSYKSDTKAALEHAWGTPVKGEDGEHTYTCANDTAHTKVEDCSPKTSTVTEPTCTEGGITTNTCACGYVYTSDPTEPTDHAWSTLGEGTDGKHTLVCGNDPTHTKREDCSFEQSVTAPTCTEDGFTTYTCACGHSYVSDPTEATGHVYDLSRWAYNDSAHYRVAICGCEDEIDERAEHTFTAVTTAATCEAGGFTTYTCACGYSYVGDQTAAKGHSVTAWTETDAKLFDDKSCIYTVYYKGECPTCKSTVTKTETAERHAWFDRVVTVATCVEDGVKGTFCAAKSCKYHDTPLATETYEDTGAHVWVLPEEDKTQPLSESKKETVETYVCDVDGCKATKTVAKDSSAKLEGGFDVGTSEIELPDATIGIDDAIKNNEAFKDKDVTISAGILTDKQKAAAIENANLSDDDLALLGNNKIYSFTISTGTDDPISQLGGTATIRIPYELQNGDDPSHIIVWYIEDGNLEPHVAVYAEDEGGAGYVTFETTHFSYYTVTRVTPTWLCDRYGHPEDRLTVIAPTCTAVGYKLCERCGRQVEDSVESATGHTFGKTVIKAATCAENGICRVSCSSCELSYDTPIAATGHYYVLSAQATASCKTAGSMTHSCAYCGDSYTMTTPKTAHKVSSYTVASTCSTRGYTVTSCEICGMTYTTYNVPAVGHTPGDAWYATEDGHFRICTVCGEALETIAHNPGAEPTEDDPQRCTVCSYTLAPPKEHEHHLTTVPGIQPTCTTGGSIPYFVCECGMWFKDEEATEPIMNRADVLLNAKGHERTNVPAVEPTCEEGGFTSGVYCSVCDTYLRGHIALPEYGHDYIRRTVAPTCTDEGTVIYFCAACGDTEGMEPETLAPLGHSTYTVVTAPTCLAAGETVAHCRRCDFTETVDTTKALGHSYSSRLVAAEEGHYTLCVRCDSRTETVAHTAVTNELGGISCVHCNYVIKEADDHTHAPKTSIPEIAPTCITNGNIAYYICACGEWFADEACTVILYDHNAVQIRAYGHGSVYVAPTPSTCTEQGYGAGVYCDRCGSWLSGHAQLPLGDHAFGNWTTVTAPTCEGAGEQVRACVVCQKSETRTTEPLGHNTVQHEGKAPTCSEGGFRPYVTCLRCDYTTFELLPATEKHTYRDGFCSVCGAADPNANPTAPVYVYEYDMGGMIAYYEFFEGGTLTLTVDGKVVTNLFWHQEEDVVYIYNEESMSEPTGCLRVEDGTLVPYVCEGEHSYVLHNASAPTCGSEGFETYRCTFCGYTYTETLPATGEHSYDGGFCTVCGEKDPNGEEESKLLYTFTMTEGEDTLTVYFYDGGIARASFGEQSMIAYWANENGLIRLYQDPEHTKAGGCFTIGEDGTLSMYECNGEHDYRLVESTKPTCGTEGREVYECYYCGSGYGTTFPATGEHTYEGGFCTVCGTQDPNSGEVVDIETYRMQIVEQMTTDWVKMLEMYGELPDYEETYRFLIDMVKSAEEREHIDGYYEKFTILLRQIHEEMGAESSCKHEDYYPIEGKAPTCTEEGYQTFACNRCGETWTETIPMEDHIVGADGTCQNCGAVIGGTTENIEALRSTILEKMYNLWNELSASFAITEEQAVRYDDLYFTVRVAKSADEINSTYKEFLSLTDEIHKGGEGSCKHANRTLIDKKPATCTEEGYETYRCDDCGVTFTQYYMLNHVDEDMDGLCDGCGAVFGDNTENIEALRSTILEKMYNLWNELSASYAINEEQAVRYDDLYYTVRVAKSTDEIHVAYEEFLSLTDEIRKGGESTEDVIHSITLSQTSFSVPVGTSIKEFLSELEAGKLQLLLDYSQSGIQSVPVTLSMIRANESYGEAFDTVGKSYTFYVTYETSSVSANLSFTVCPMPDMEGAQFMGEYTLVMMQTEEYSVSAIIQLYSNSYATMQNVMNGELQGDPIYTTYRLEGTTLYLESDGVTAVITISETGAASFYIPSEQDTLIGTYYYSGMTVYVYGEYTGAGEYIFVIEYTPAPDMTMRQAMLGTLDTENATICCAIFGGSNPLRYFDEGGNIYCKHNFLLCGSYAGDCYNGAYDEYRCEFCGEGYRTEGEIPGHSDNDGNGYCDRCGMSMGGSDIGTLRDETIAKMERVWTRVINSYPISDSHTMRYNELYKEAFNAQDAATLEKVYMSFEQFIAEIEKMGNDYIMYIELGSNDYVTTVGMSIEELLAELTNENLYLNLNYSQSGTHQIPVTRDMIMPHEYGETFTEIGKTYHFTVYYVSDSFSGSCHLYVTAEPDMSGAQFMGEYMLSMTMGDQSVSALIQLYDNGFARMTSFVEGESEDTVYAAYKQEGTTLYLTVDGMTIVLTVSETGTATFYQVTDADIHLGTYYYQGVEINLYGKYQGAGEYIGLIKMPMDETTVIEQSVLMYLDLEGCRIGCVIFSSNDNLYFDEAGNIYCPHEWSEEYREPSCQSEGYRETYCKICGERSFESIPPIGHNDESGDGYCDYCGMYMGGSDDAFAQLRDERLDKMYAVWEQVTSSFSVSEFHVNRFYELCEKMKNVSNTEEVEYVYSLFEELVYEIEQEANADQLVNAYLSMNHIHVTEGQSIKDVLTDLTNERLLFTLCFSQSGETTVSVTYDMIEMPDRYGETFTNVGEEYAFRIVYESELGSHSITLYLLCIPDLSEAEHLGDYTLTIRYGDTELVTTVSLYEGGTALLSSNEGDTAVGSFELDGTTLYLTQNELTMVLTLNEDGTAEFFALPEDATVIGTYSYYDNLFTVYGPYTTAGYYPCVLTVMLPGGTPLNQTILVELDLEACTIACALFGGNSFVRHFDAAGSIYCEHDYELTDSYEGSCTEDGYENFRCTVCGTGYSNTIVAPGHSFGEDGYCTVCGISQESDTDLHIYIKELYNELSMRWDEASMMFDTSSYKESYSSLMNNLLKAQTMEEAKCFVEEISALIDCIYNGEEVEKEDTLLSIGSDLPQLVFTAGEDFETFLQKNVLGYTLYVDMSLTGEHAVIITRDMIDLTFFDPSKAGEQNIVVNVTVEGQTFGYTVTVQVDLTLEGAEQIGTFKVDDAAAMGLGFSELTLYDNLVCAIGERLLSYSYYGEDVIRMNITGTDVLFRLSFDEMRAMNFTETDTTTRYTLYEDMITEIVILDPYNGVGDYLALLTRTMDGQSFTVTTLVYWELSGMRLTHALIGSCIFDEQGVLSRDECAHDSTRYTVNVQNPTCTQEGIIHVFCGVCNEMLEAQYVGFGSHSFDESDCCIWCGYQEGREESIYVKDYTVSVDAVTVLVGDSVETLIETLLRNKLSVSLYLSDGTVQEYYPVRDDFMTELTDLSSVGNTGLYFNVSYDGFSTTCRISVSVTPNMEGATLVGSYIYESEYKNPVGFKQIELYDNKYLCMDGEMYLSYHLNDTGILTFRFEDVPVYYLLNEDQHTFAPYVPAEEELIGCYVWESQECFMNVYRTTYDAGNITVFGHVSDTMTILVITTELSADGQWLTVSAYGETLRIDGARLYLPCDHGNDPDDCESCQQENGSEIKPTGCPHTNVTDIVTVKEATETENGYGTYDCLDCGMTFTVYFTAVNPDYTLDGSGNDYSIVYGEVDTTNAYAG